MGFPPTAAQQFKSGGGKGKDGEGLAEGFRMSFDAPGKLYRIRIDLPRQATCGPKFLNFYASFYHNAHMSSIVETGVSFSPAKKWNFFANCGGIAPEHRLGDDLTKVPSLELLVHFVPADSGSGGRVFSKLGGGLGLEQYLANLKPVNMMRLVIATGDHTAASFSEVGMTLLEIDGKPPRRSGFVEYMSGSNIDSSHRQMVFSGSSPYGLRGSLSLGTS